MGTGTGCLVSHLRKACPTYRGSAPLHVARCSCSSNAFLTRTAMITTRNFQSYNLLVADKKKKEKVDVLCGK